MNYLLALILPPVAVLLTKRPIAAIVLALLWIVGLVLLTVIGHFVCVVLAWLIIAGARSDRNTQRIISEINKDKD